MYRLVVVCEVAGYVDAEGAGHAIGACCARNGWDSGHDIGNLRENCILGISARFEWRERVDVVNEVLHAVHAAECGEDVRV